MIRKSFKLILQTLGCLVLVSSSCQKESVPAATGGQRTTQHISVSSADLTKTAGLADIVWLPSDSLSVFDSGLRNNVFNNEGTAEESTASFSGEVGSGTSMNYAVYPYQEDASITAAGVITATVPAKVAFDRSGSIASGANLSAGIIAGDGSVRMKNLCGVVGFKVTDENVLWVRISSNDGSALAGKVRFSFVEGTPTVTEVVEGQASVTGYVPGPGTYYFSVLPGSYEGVSVEVHYANWVQNYTASTSNTMVVSRSAILSHPDIPASSAVYVPDALVAQMKSCASMDADFLVENTYVNNYRTQVVYPNDDYSFSRVRDFYNLNTDGRQCYPAEKKVSWTVDGVSTSQKMIIVDGTTDQVFADDLDNTLRTIRIMNFIPGHTYYYAVARINHLDGTYTVFKKGAFNAVGQVRMLKVTATINKYVQNIRDVGGWTGTGGKKIAYGKLLRGYALNDNNNNNEVRPDWAGIKTLRDAGVRAELDIRAGMTYTASVLGPDVQYINNGTTSCMDIGLKYTPTAYRDMLATIAYNLNHSVTTYVHCAGGADRTGTIFYLVLGLCGVSESDLAKEYELTSFNHTNRYRCNKDGYDEVDDPEHQNNPMGELRFRNMMEYLMTFEGATINEKIETFVTGTLGITAQQIADIRSGLLE